MKDHPQELSDEYLARQTQAGSTECYEELLTRYETRIYNFLRKKTPNLQDVEDITQATFVTAYRRIHLFDPKYKFSTWLFTIAGRLAISHYRASRPTEPLQHEEADDRDPSTILSENEAGSTLWATAKRRLTETQFMALWLMYGEDQSIRDIARIMKQSHSNVKVLLHRARTAMAKVLGSAFEARPAAALEGGPP